jgi:hypothetical protein
LPLPSRARNLSNAMIHDVDESLRALVRRDAVNGSGVEVAFDAPTKEWVARRNSPVVDLYLYDIREDSSRRQTSWVDIRDDSGRVIERRLPPRRYRLSYLVTAWTQRPEDEHRLLSALLSCFVRHEYLPAELLSGSLEGETVPILLTVALPPAEDRSIADVWSAMGGELKPSLDLVVTAPMNIERSLEAGPPVLEEPRLLLLGPDGASAGLADQASEEADAPAAVAKKRTAAAKKRVASEATIVRRPAAEASADAPEGLPDEVLSAGTPDQPGRRIRVRQFIRQ